MRVGYTWIAVLFLFLLVSLFVAGEFPGSALAQGANLAESNPLELTDDQDGYHLGRSLEILVDPGGELTIEDVTSPSYAAQFVPSQVDVPNYGFTSSVYWVRLPLENHSERFEQWLLEVGFANMHFVDLYTPIPDGSGFSVKQSGTSRPVTSRDLRYAKITFDLTIPSESQQTYYLRFENEASMTLPLSLWTPNAFIHRAQVAVGLHSVYFGALLALALYNAFLFFSVREGTYLYLVALLISMVLFEASYSGYAETYWAPNLFRLQNSAVIISFIMMLASTILFADAFLVMREHSPRLHRLNLILLVGWGVLALIPFSSYLNTIRLVLPFALITLGTLIAASFKIWWQGIKYSRFFIVAWLGLPVGLTITILMRISLLPSTAITEHAYQIGALWLSIAWSLALADRINKLRGELQSSERHLSQILEGLPVGVVMYGKDRIPNYINRRVYEILGNPDRSIMPDLSARRTLDQAMSYFSFRVEGTDQPYPLSRMPVQRALEGESDTVDDVEADLIDRRVPLEVWASPIFDDSGAVTAAIVALQDITRRKKTLAENVQFRLHLEEMVEQRTEDLTLLNRWLAFVNELQHSLSGMTRLSQVNERILTELRQLTGAHSLSFSLWKEPKTEIEAVCLLQSGPGGIIRRLTVPTDGSSGLRQLVEEDTLQVRRIPSESTKALPLALCMDDPAISSVILAPFNTTYGARGMISLWMARPADSYTEHEFQFYERIRTDLATLSDYEHLQDWVRRLGASEERNRLARDLHDSVTQVLFSASVLADILPTALERDPQQAIESADALRLLTRGALAEMRTLLLELRPAAIIKTPLHDLISQLTEAVVSRSNLSFRLLIEQIPETPEEVHVGFYRVAQEALNNAVKHAKASQVTVHLRTTPIHSNAAGVPSQEVKLSIIDDGVGFSPADEHTAGMGLNIMKERASDIDADLTIVSEIGQGTSVDLAWPGSAGSERMLSVGQIGSTVPTNS